MKLFFPFVTNVSMSGLPEGLFKKKKKLTILAMQLLALSFR